MYPTITILISLPSTLKSKEIHIHKRKGQKYTINGNKKEY